MWHPEIMYGTERLIRRDSLSIFNLNPACSWPKISSYFRLLWYHSDPRIMRWGEVFTIFSWNDKIMTRFTGSIVLWPFCPMVMMQALAGQLTLQLSDRSFPHPGECVCLVFLPICSNFSIMFIPRRVEWIRLLLPIFCAIFLFLTIFHHQDNCLDLR